MLLPMTGPVPARTLRRYMVALRAAGASKEAFRPRLAVESWAALNAVTVTELEADLPRRHLDDGRSVKEALAEGCTSDFVGAGDRGAGPGEIGRQLQ